MSSSCFYKGQCSSAGCTGVLFWVPGTATTTCHDCGVRWCTDDVSTKTLLSEENTTATDFVELLGNVMQRFSRKGTEKRQLPQAPRSKVRAAKQFTPPSLQSVHGLSGFESKLIGPLVTYYGPGKGDLANKPVLLKELGLNEFFDCGKTASRAFRISEKDLELSGYGRDQSGSQQYLASTLDAIKAVNNDEERLVPLHASGDGHCLVHALSRCIVGREFFWHALRINLHQHLKEHKDRYLALLSDFFDDAEWELIVAEASPDFVPKPSEALGLRKVHIFGLANVLRRPIMLFDSVTGMASTGDYSGVFLPVLQEPEHCTDPATGKPFLPLAVAWSSAAYSHYVPLVPVKERGLPRIPLSMLPAVWGGVPESSLSLYLDVSQDFVQIGGTRELNNDFALKTRHVMAQQFFKEHNVDITVVQGVFLHTYRGLPIVSVPSLIQKSQELMSSQQLVMCLCCEKMFVKKSEYKESDLMPGGWMYDALKTCRKSINPHHPLDAKYEHNRYNFPALPGLLFTYSPATDKITEIEEVYSAKELAPGGKYYEFSNKDGLRPGTSYPISDPAHPSLRLDFFYDETNDRLVNRYRPFCPDCFGHVRRLNPDGTIRYFNGDTTKVPKSSGEGFKTFWDGKYLENHPLLETVPVTHKGLSHPALVSLAFIYGEEDPLLNSNPHKMAKDAIALHFPGDFTTNLLEQALVERIYSWLDTTKLALPRAHNPYQPSDVPPMPQFSPYKAQKTSMTVGNRVLSKDDLGLSKAETLLKEKLKETSLKHAKASSAKASAVTALSTTAGHATQKEQPKTPKDQPKAKSSSNDEFTIRLMSSNGSQRLQLLRGASWLDLQELVAQKTQVPIMKQQFHTGKKHQLLEFAENEPVHLSHGDRLFLEVKPDPTPTFAMKGTSSPFGSLHDRPFGSLNDDTSRGFGFSKGSVNPSTTLGAEASPWSTKRSTKPTTRARGFQNSPSGKLGKRPRTADAGCGAGPGGMAGLRDQIDDVMSELLKSADSVTDDLGPKGVIASVAKLRFGTLTDQQVIEFPELPNRHFRFKASSKSFEEVEPVTTHMRSLGSVQYRPIRFKRFQGEGQTLASDP